MATQTDKKQKTVNLYDIHIKDGECVTLRIGWYMRIQGEGRFYQIKGIEPDGALSLDTWHEDKKTGISQLTARANGYQYNTQSFEYSAGKYWLLVQRNPFGTVQQPTPTPKPVKHKETQQNPPQPVTTTAQPQGDSSILNLFGI